MPIARTQRLQTELNNFARVNKAYKATREDELSLVARETLIVYEIDEEGWATGGSTNNDER